jgi:hypothetical protein
MKKASILLLLTLLFGTNVVFAQTSLQKPRNIEKAIQNGTRSENGQPGANYWQNKARYDIDISFDPGSRLINGKVNIEYWNNSPDTLNQLLLKLYHNVTKIGAVRDRKLAPEDVNDGVQIMNIWVRNMPIDLDAMTIDGINALVPVEPIAPGTSASLVIDYFLIMSKDFPSHRSGQIDESSFFVSYFFPRIAVYDDIDGWNTFPFWGATEFYNDFSDFNVRITLPDPYIVWATGEQVNPEEVFLPKIIKRIAEAEQSDKKISVIEKADLENKAVTLGNLKNTFEFKAENVTDFAFGTSKHYVWDASSVEVDPSTKRRTRVDAVYDDAHENYRLVHEWNRKTVEAMSYFYPKWPFPFSHQTVFEGLAQMEFPMITNIVNNRDTTYLSQVVIHEVFHAMFPFYMGFNEKKYAWMDEGITTTGEWLIYPQIYPGEVDNWGLQGYEKVAGSDKDAPIMTLSTNLSGLSYTTLSYAKSGFAFVTLKDLLGDELFFRGLHHFIENWHGKHPNPWDLFYSFNEGTGKDLNWFWESWFFGNGYPDLAIKDVSSKYAIKKVTVEMKGGLPVPVNLKVKYADDSEEIIHRNISIWKSGKTQVSIEIPGKKELKSLILEGSHIPDVDKSDNVWPRK